MGKWRGQKTHNRPRHDGKTCTHDFSIIISIIKPPQKQQTLQVAHYSLVAIKQKQKRKPQQFPPPSLIQSTSRVKLFLYWSYGGRFGLTLTRHQEQWRNQQSTALRSSFFNSRLVQNKASLHSSIHRSKTGCLEDYSRRRWWWKEAEATTTTTTATLLKYTTGALKHCRSNQ